MKASALPLVLLSNLDDGAVKPSLRNPSARARAPPAVVGGMPDREMGPLSLPFPISHFPGLFSFFVASAVPSVELYVRVHHLCHHYRHRTTFLHHQLPCFLLIPCLCVDMSTFSIALHLRYVAVCQETGLIMRPLTHREQCCPHQSYK